MIDYDEFSKIELKVATIVSAERVIDSEKLIKLSVCLGEGEERQVVAGIGRKYSPEDIIGRQVVVVCNLNPRKLMGLESRGMLLAADGGDGPVLLTTFEKVSDGASIK